MKSGAWFADITPVQWKTLFAGFMGWLLDAFDAMLFSFSLLSLRGEFSLTNPQMGMLGSIALLTSIGGTLFGFLADRIGRVRALSWSILTYSVFTALFATSHSLPELILWRALVGFGLGGEWAAGSALVAETWPAHARGKAIGFMQSGWAIGYMLAAAVATFVLPRWGWRALFLLGIVPALFTFWIRRNLSGVELPRSAVARLSPGAAFAAIFAAERRRTSLIAIAITTTVLFAYWGLFTWIPAFLASPIEKGGAGISMMKSAAWIIPMQVGSFFGYITFGFFSDRFGRRPSFLVFVLGAAFFVLLYGNLGAHPGWLLALGPAVGFFGHGYFSVFGALLAELFPDAIRATAQAFCYNAGRAFSAFAPMAIGYLSESAGVGGALTTTAAFFVASAGLIYFLPETKGKELQAS